MEEDVNPLVTSQIPYLIIHVGTGAQQPHPSFNNSLSLLYLKYLTMDKSLPTPPMEDSGKVGTGARRNITTSTKSVKPVHRNSKRASQTSHSPVHDHSPLSEHGANMDRHKRVWKACERCRQKKTKCDGEFPCKRCKDDGLVCTAGTRKKTEYKQLPRG